MSLKSFHIVFITVSCLLAFGFGVWCVQLDRLEGFFPVGVASFAVGVALVVYGVWFLRKLKKWDDDAAKR